MTGLADLDRVVIKEEFGRQGSVHGPIMPRDVAGSCQV
jgi:hypothetical protein